MCGENGDRRRAQMGANTPQHLQAVHPRHAEIEQYGIDGFAAEHGERGFTGGRRARIIAEIAHRLDQYVAHCGVIVDDQDGCHGTMISKVVSCSEAASRAVPPWAAATSRTIDRPSPVPSARPVTNGSNKCSRMPAGGPAP